MKIMVVESPNKVEKIAGYLGDGWKVVASAGHIRDLPQKSFGISKPNFDLEYEFIPPVKVGDRTFPGAEQRVSRIRRDTASAEMVYLATDPDREGEAIAWHLKDALSLGDSDYRRVTFTEITDKAIHAALSAPRDIDMALVHAQEGRRALDRIVGYMVSPLLSDMLGMSLSAGRVQSIAVRLVVDLERRIKAFKSTNHFGATVIFDGGAWSAQWDTKPYVTDDAPYLLDEGIAGRASACRQFRVLESTGEDASERPPSPFSTSLMLRAASASLKMSADATTKASQKLFEQGVINYIRTDSVNLGDDAIAEIRDFAAGKGFALPDQPRRWKEKAGAQQGHEAIRPTHIEVEEAGDDEAQRALYRLIRQRAIASQLADARYRVNTVRLVATDSNEGFEYTAKGRVLTVPGWRGLTKQDAVEEADAAGDDAAEADGGKVPMLEVGGAKQADDGKLLRKKTQPPRRYTEAGLIAKLEAEGIGRPATYAAIMKNIMSRRYVVEEKRLLVPTEIGELIVDNLVRGNFAFMELDFTRRLEVDLDAIAEGRTSYVNVVAPAYRQLNEELARVATSGEFTPRFKCPKCSQGLRLYTKSARGPFWRCTNEACGHFMDDDKGKPIERASHPCPTCGTALRRYKRKSGSGFVWACPGEGCETFLDDLGGKPLAGHACPKCSAALRRYQKKDKETGKGTGRHAWFCTNEECKTFMDDDKGKPVAIKTAPCPSCGKPMFRRNGQYGWFWGCSGYKDGCKVMMDDQNGKPVPKAMKKPGTGKRPSRKS
ncbi:type I DNA topoisomerase [Rhizobium sp. TRM95111]|uniref:type I DNA topoisomerase n=1 Tax=Rhizobium alarense TaxID=2846851 RepID=UPI001F01D787|nr:type I DNA topoisomerase [Rhizobium alarense]MCF3642942.1 type I DNA topoisomerase [Rhizobium alarense]